jgi:hypothetical protein
MMLYPLQQDPGEMQADLEARVPLQYLQKREIAVVISMLEHVLEIADGLMIVNGESEFDFLHNTCLRMVMSPFVLFASETKIYYRLSSIFNP